MRKQIFIGVALLIMATVARPALASDIKFTIGEFDWFDPSVLDSSFLPGPELSIVNFATSPLFFDPASATIPGFTGGSFESFLLTPFVDPGQTPGTGLVFPSLPAGDHTSFGLFDPLYKVQLGFTFLYTLSDARFADLRQCVVVAVGFDCSQDYSLQLLKSEADANGGFTSQLIDLTLTEPTTVPEPGTFALLASGLALAVGVGRFRGRSTRAA